MSSKTSNNIICGDCLEVMSNMPDNSVDITFTSPPYNRKRDDKYEYYSDTKSDYLAFLITTIDEMIRVTKGNVFVNVQKNYYNKADVFNLIGHYSEQIAEIFIWEKSNPMPNPHVINAYEFVICFGEKLKANHTYTKNHLTTSVFTGKNKAHRAVMHPKVAEFFIENFTKPDDIVFDPFLGLGTTAVVAVKHGRNFAGCEIIEDYCKIAHERIKSVRSSPLFGEIPQ